jgi:hypothetical protein
MDGCEQGCKKQQNYDAELRKVMFNEVAASVYQTLVEAHVAVHAENGNMPDAGDLAPYAETAAEAATYFVRCLQAQLKGGGLA